MSTLRIFGACLTLLAGVVACRSEPVAPAAHVSIRVAGFVESVGLT